MNQTTNVGNFSNGKRICQSGKTLEWKVWMKPTSWASHELSVPALLPRHEIDVVKDVVLFCHGSVAWHPYFFIYWNTSHDDHVMPREVIHQIMDMGDISLAKRMLDLPKSWTLFHICYLIVILLYIKWVISKFILALLVFLQNYWSLHS